MAAAAVAASRGMVQNSVKGRPSVVPGGRRASFRAVALDMDGTTLNDAHALTARTVETIRAVHAKDLHVIIATGRPAPAVQPFIDQLRLAKPVPVVCFNGAVAAELSPSSSCSSTEEGNPVTEAGAEPSPVSSASSSSESGRRTIFADNLDREAVEQVIKLSRELGLCVMYYLLDGAAAVPRSAEQEETLQLFERIEGFKYRRLEDLDALLALKEPPLKIVVLATDVQAIAARARDVLPEGLCHVVAAEMHVEFVHPSVSKGRTLVRLLRDELAVDLEHVIAFGDNENDMDMLQAVGEGVAMRNAKDCVKAVANRTSEWTNDDEGVARELSGLLGRL
eukprot:TRINITY_DN36667_c0_g1_i1.p1 TRINITY_DN36667_c0_g1~~TRINITY_DN36667_c0_g1_i1.p1  ORF type:complete len:337 (+),score=81.36 TRINITY_DN36667_c0_g1_i1:130-1140(+)